MSTNPSERVEPDVSPDMGKDTPLVSEAKAQAAALVTDAVRTAEDLVHTATTTAEELVHGATSTAAKLLDENEERMTTALANALREVFGENQDARRFIDITRIPL